MSKHSFDEHEEDSESRKAKIHTSFLSKVPNREGLPAELSREVKSYIGKKMGYIFFLSY